jgi:hypothetical protein
MTMHSPSDFSLKRHPMMSLPVSDDGRCRVGQDVQLSGVTGLCSWSLARKGLRTVRASSRWARESLVDVVSAAAEIFSVSKRLAPGSTSGAGKRIMLSEIRIEFVS